MPLRALTLIAATIATASGIAVAMASAAAHGSEEDAPTAARVSSVERTLLRDAVAADTANARRRLAPDFQLIDPFGAPESRKTYLDTIGGGVDFVTMKPLSPIRVRLYGNTAVARFQAAFDVIAGPDRLKHRGWITDLFERRSARWVLVWSQVTATPNDADLLVQALKARS